MLRTSIRLLVVPLFCVAASAEIILPGTQPNEGGIEFGKVAQCMLCHSGTTNGAADPYFSWQGSMMAQAARDPVFRASLAIANQDIKGVGEFCIRCHAPRGWFAGRSSASDGSLLNREDMHGVSCEVCHHLVNPLSAEAKQLVKKVPPGFGNAMMVADPENVVRGPYADSKGAMPHKTMQSSFQASGELCGTCHNVSNPTVATDVNTQPPHSFGHLERTYSEWAQSDFAKKESLQSCQSCHFVRVPGGGKPSRYGDLQRDYFVSHSAVGGSSWVQEATYHLWKGKDLDPDALEAGRQHARDFLKTAAALSLEISGAKARLIITNLTGHKLPTGYPEGRRMWVNMRFMNRAGQVISELGRYGEKEDRLAGQTVKVPTLLDPEKTRVYECVLAISDAQAAKFNTQPGPSFHFVLNDTVASDNRIPPRGYKKAAFAEHLCEPRGANYADGQFWDVIELALPAGTEKVEARLMYQSVSWEYLKFLHEKNQTDDWGRKLYDVWAETGQCPPDVMAAVVRSVVR